MVYIQKIVCCGCSIAQLCPTLCHPIDCSIPGFPVLHHPLEFAQTHIHWITDVIQPSSPLLPLSPPVLKLSQHLGLFQWVGYSQQGADTKSKKSRDHRLQTEFTNTRGTPPWDQMSSGSWIGRRMPGISSAEGHFSKVKKHNYATR